MNKQGMMPRLTTVIIATVGIAAPSAEASFEPQKSLAGVSLQMTREQVERTLGEGLIVVDGPRTPSSFSIFYPKLHVYFVRGKVKTVSTTRRSERTGTNVGVGSTMAQVMNEVPGSSCPPRYGFTLCKVGGLRQGDVGSYFWINDAGRVSRLGLGRPY